MKSKKTSTSQRRKSNIIQRGGKISFRKKKDHVIHLEEHTSTEDWKRICAAAPIPEIGRIMIRAAIAQYRIRIAAEQRSLKTKRRIARMRNAIRKLLNEGECLKDDKIFFNAGLEDWRSRTGPNAADLTERFQSVMELDQILSDAQDRMSARRGRKSLNNLEYLIKGLVRSYADATNGSHLKRSTKAGFARPTNRFVVECVKIADPGLSEASIENVLTRVISEHHQILSKDGFNTATGDYVQN